ncbi:hypothetical protein [Pleionea sp. CnH1-48]|uniref:hypothetical protein n=1 Tax=Pleionea sp. CnH1-48 TaxID=2954494 RepID=UPI002096F8BB|nr:hypothetical protein [Pleionea sp. CnH1-48]MCO7223068.1 hypothetical protein [Pleionea sp. CnH1-48]
MKKQFAITIATIFLIPVSLHAAESESKKQEPAATTQVVESQLGLTIRGVNELPNVLYIVPWKPGPENNVSPIQGRVVEEIYGPVEANVFKRKVKLYRSLNKRLNNSENSK